MTENTMTMPKKRGRPTLYTPGVAKKICDLMQTGETLLAICRENTDLPTDACIRKWAAEDREGFYAEYARAREIGIDAMVDKMLALAFDETGDVDDDGKWSHANVQRSRLKTDVIRWYVSKIAPKRYGEKIDHTVGGEGGGPIMVQIVKFAPEKEEGDG